MDERNTNVSEIEQQEPMDHSDICSYTHFDAPEQKRPQKKSKLKMPTLAQLLASKFNERQYLLFPWLREQESCMIYAESGLGKSMFALSAALAVAGGGEFLGWKPEARANATAGCRNIEHFASNSRKP